MKNEKENRKYFYILTGLSIVNFIALLFMLPKLPQSIPVHWGLSGAIDGFANKNILFLLGVIPIIIPVGMYFTKKIDPKIGNYKYFDSIYLGFCGTLTLFLILICWLAVFAALGFLSFRSPTVIPRIICLVLGIPLIVYGNLSPRIKQNWFFGIKTPWALENERNWQKTQRFGGFVMIAFGILLLLCGFFYNIALIIFSFVFLFAGFGATFLYSYLLHVQTQA